MNYKIEEVPQSDILSTRIVKKKQWNPQTQQFEAYTICHVYYTKLTASHKEWLKENFGPESQNIKADTWNCIRMDSDQDHVIMGEKVYTWFRLKWNEL